MCSHCVSLCVQICYPLVWQLVWLCWLESSSASSSLCWTGSTVQCTQLFKYINNWHDVHKNPEECWFMLSADVSACVSLRNQPLINNNAINQDSAFDLYDCKIDVRQDLLIQYLVQPLQIQMINNLFFYFQGTQHGTESDFSFFNKLYNPSPHVTDASMASSDA